MGGTAQWNYADLPEANLIEEIKTCVDPIDVSWGSAAIHTEAERLGCAKSCPAVLSLLDDTYFGRAKRP